MSRIRKFKLTGWGEAEREIVHPADDAEWGGGRVASFGSAQGRQDDSGEQGQFEF